MYRLLIADDEELVRRGLAALVKREVPDIRIVGTATDGPEALALAERTRPDIVLTDIRMPGLNGLDLIERLRAVRPDLQCIILSGYDEFAYARRAIGLGVADYLLKPVDPDHLLALLARIQERLAATRAEHEARLAMQRAAAEHSIRRLFNGVDVDVAGALAYRPIPAAWGVLLIRIAPASRSDVETLCRQHHPDALVVEDAYGYLCLILPLPDGTPATVAHEAERLAQQLREAAYPGVVTAARPCPEPSGIRPAYQEAVDVAEYHSAGLDGCPLLTWQILAPQGERWPALPLAHRDALLQAVAQGVDEDAMHEARAFMRYIRDHLSPGAVRALWCEMVVLVIHHVQQFGVRADALLEPQESVHTILAGSVDPDALESRLVALVGRAARECGLVRRQHAPRGTIAELRTYIETHLADDLTIPTLARRVHLSAKYLGELFKNTTGEPLGEFIIRTRMRKACELLSGSQLKVYAIAEQVGYSSPKHFATMFRSIVGVTPAEYREQHRREAPAPEVTI